jgi:hypothetical protein
MPRRDERRFEQVEAQRNGVRYDTPIREWHAYRFTPVASSAWEKTPVHGSTAWESKPAEHVDALKAIAAWSAGRNPRTMGNHDIDGGQQVIHYAWGLGATNESELEWDGGVHFSSTLASRYAAYCVKMGIEPSGLRHYTNAPGIWEQHWSVKRAWEQWQRMNGL